MPLAQLEVGDDRLGAEPGAGWGGARGELPVGRPAAPDPLTPVCLDWIAYTNVPNADMADWETAYWGEGVDRLRAIKAKYDPHNVFSFEQSIPLAQPG